ncbi:MAG: NAD-dependent deacylase [Chloroflexi bacterium]|nr:NAD-dependent deacylase [Chloroflexota bacterium]
MRQVAQDRAAIEQAANLLRSARKAVALTGAGFSTPSGIPDFRSKASGLWTRDDPMQVAALSVFRRNPERFYGWIRSLHANIWNAQPNPAHLALARLEQAGYLKAVITQNIDSLHQKAGAAHVLELHGSLRTLTCLHCRRSFEAEPFVVPFISEGAIPHCPTCQRVLKPDIILFDEMLPPDIWQEAVGFAQSCDLMLVSGSSLEVLPAADLPRLALESGARLIINNLTPTHLDHYADLILPQDLAWVIPSLAEAVL